MGVQPGVGENGQMPQETALFCPSSSAPRTDRGASAVGMPLIPAPVRGWLTGWFAAASYMVANKVARSWSESGTDGPDGPDGAPCGGPHRSESWHAFTDVRKAVTNR